MVSEQQKLRQQQPAKAQTCPDAPLDGPQSRLAPVELTTDSSCLRDVLDFLSLRFVPAISKASSTTKPHKVSPAIYGGVFVPPALHGRVFSSHVLGGVSFGPPIYWRVSLRQNHAANARLKRKSQSVGIIEIYPLGDCLSRVELAIT